MAITYTSVFQLAAITLAVIVLGGCSRSKAPGVYVSDRGLYIKDMSPRDIIACVNGVNIRKSDYNEISEFQEFLFRICNKLPLEGRNEKAEKFTYTSEQRWPELLIKNELMLQEAERLGIKVSAEVVDRQWQKISRALHRPGLALADFSSQFGDARAAQMMQLLESEARAELVLNAFTSNAHEVVTAADVTNRMNWVEAFNKNADDCNREAVELLKKVRQEVLGGLDFAAAGVRYSEVKPEDGKQWSTVELNELPDDRDGKKNPLRTWLESAKPGDISMPMDMDDGISIVKLLSVYLGEAPAGYERPMCYRLARCTRFAREHSQFQNEDETRRQLLKWKREDALAELGRQVFAAAVMEFPNGTNFFPSVEESYRYWQEEFKKRR